MIEAMICDVKPHDKIEIKISNYFITKETFSCHRKCFDFNKFYEKCTSKESKVDLFINDFIDVEILVYECNKRPKF